MQKEIELKCLCDGLLDALREMGLTCPLISRRGNVSNSLKVSRHILPASGCRERNAA